MLLLMVMLLVPRRRGRLLADAQLLLSLLSLLSGSFRLCCLSVFFILEPFR